MNVQLLRWNYNTQTTKSVETFQTKPIFYTVWKFSKLKNAGTKSECSLTSRNIKYFNFPHSEFPVRWPNKRLDRRQRVDPFINADVALQLLRNCNKSLPFTPRYVNLAPRCTRRESCIIHNSDEKILRVGWNSHFARLISIYYVDIWWKCNDETRCDVCDANLSLVSIALGWVFTLSK